MVQAHGSGYIANQKARGSRVLVQVRVLGAPVDAAGSFFGVLPFIENIAKRFVNCGKFRIWVRRMITLALTCCQNRKDCTSNVNNAYM